MKSPRFTVITPTFEQAAYIGDTIESVLSQSFKDFEYIIDDSCSMDGTKEIVEMYAARDERIRYIREKDKGQADGINKGLKAAKGEIVCWLNSDDMYFGNDVLEKVDRAFRKAKGTSLVIGDAWYCDKDKNLTEYNNSDRGGGKWLIRRWYYIVQPACFWKNEHRLLDTRYHYVFDWKFFTERFEEGRVVFTHEPYALYRMYEDNKTGLNNAARRKEVYRLQKELGDSKLNILWCRHVYRAYKKAEETGRESIKKRTDLWSKILFHISARRIAGF